jgi:ribosome-associated heat shock protein Hsp15
VVALGIRRGPAPEAQSLYSDLDPPLPSIKTVTAIREAGQRDAGSGRPTKRDRREIDRLQHDE